MKTIVEVKRIPYGLNGKIDVVVIREPRKEAKINVYGAIAIANTAKKCARTFRVPTPDILLYKFIDANDEKRDKKLITELAEMNDEIYEAVVNLREIRYYDKEFFVDVTDAIDLIAQIEELDYNKPADKEYINNIAIAFVKFIFNQEETIKYLTKQMIDNNNLHIRVNELEAEKEEIRAQLEANKTRKEQVEEKLIDTQIQIEAILENLRNI
jgi:hypothetical protein